MTFITYIAYPTTPGGRFDLEYYNTTHMAIVERHWKGLGLESWSVTSFAADAPYVALATIVWKDAASSQRAMTPENGLLEVVADLPKFTDIKAVHFSGTVAASSSL
ncbi:hypothetical protein BKA62DRAFT_710822 [Auriculariales sp. MPI-PUGE-AT-0066]|nr:hypothetical protein BKA62DRAFT_710822 [Auriculariales sp. MPI-PUGE-AT-0066]